MANEKGPPASRASIAKLIENLECLETVDVMLLEGTPAPDVAKFIQRDQGELPSVDERSLSNALLVRKHQRIEAGDWYGANKLRISDDGAEEVKPGSYRRPAKTPSSLVKSLYSRTEGGIREYLELEALYLAQRDRIDRLMELESEIGAFSDQLSKEMAVANDIAINRHKIAKDLGLTGSESRLLNDFKGYSERTSAVLRNPESRHRVISIVERIAAHARRGLPKEVEPISLPLPKVADEDKDK